MDIIDGASPTWALKRKKDPRIEQQTSNGATLFKSRSNVKRIIVTARWR